MGFNYLLFTSIVLLILSVVFNYDDRRPSSEKTKYKFRIKDNSIFRKIIRFKDKRYSPCNYFKIVPIYVFSLILILSSILYVIDLCVNKTISNYLGRITVFVPLCLSLVYYIYLFTIIIWWEIVDYKEMRLLQKKHHKDGSIKK